MREVVDEIKRRNQEGEYVKDICLDLGVSRGSVYVWCRKNGERLHSVHRAGPKHRFTDEECQEFRRRYDSGESCNKIAESLGINHKMVTAGIRRAGGCIRDIQARREISGNPHIVTILGGIKRTRASKKYGCDLTYDDVESLVLAPCYYCLLPYSNRKASLTEKEDAFLSNGIDRVDSKGGYVKGNVVPCCRHCNFAKHNKSLEEFSEWIGRIIESNTLNRIQALIDSQRN